MSRLDDAITEIETLSMALKGEKLKSDVYYIYDCLRAYRNIVETGRDCNQCKRTHCNFKPLPGQLVRYNCSFFKEAEE